MSMAYEELSKEAVEIQEHLGISYVGYTETTTLKVAKEILLYGPYYYGGTRLSPAIQHIGAGIYEVSVERG